MTQDSIRHAQVQIETGSSAVGCDPVFAAETILRRYGARAVTLLSSARTLDDGRVLPPRLSANDCYVALSEACRKMARVALRKYESQPSLQSAGFAASVDTFFPDPVAYLSRCIRSVVSDAERLTRKEPQAVSLDQPIGGTAAAGDTLLCLRDTVADSSIGGQPEELLLDSSDRARFRAALAGALRSIPQNYLQALQRDIERNRERQLGWKVGPESDRERQTVCRARAAVATILYRECGDDNSFVRLLAQQRSGRVRQKTNSASKWTADRQQRLFDRLLGSSWQERDSGTAEGNLEEAVVNEVSRSNSVAPPSPEMRNAIRVMDTYTLGDNPTAQCAEAQTLYQQARQLRHSGKIEEAIAHYRAAYQKEPRFLAAYNEVGVLLSQTGNLRDALKVYLQIFEQPDAGEHRFIAATNAADIYLTWFDAGRNKERNIERATFYAQYAMQRPTPMRACNLLL
ncbi:MAG TPA: hypothetical protein VGS41_18215, partial [Chthonomonadales bacterium]|nr:hypothetical protein [Chthonomonadales bacterium]